MTTPDATLTPTNSRVAAGEDDRIPRLFLGAADIAALGIAFLAAQAFAPAVQQLFLRGGLLQGMLPAIFAVPPVARPELFPPISEVFWIFVITAPTTLVAMELLGGYERLLGQSVGRLITGPIIAQTVAISFSALIVFALKLSSSSRVLLFTYGLFSAFALASYRSGLWMYQRRHLRNGSYAKNVVLIGQPRAISRLVERFRNEVPHTQFRLSAWLSVPTMEADAGIDSQTSNVPLEYLGSSQHLGDLLITRPVHEVIAVQSSLEREWLRDVMKHCDYFRIQLRIVPEALLAGGFHDLQLPVGHDRLRLPEVVLTPRRFDADLLFIKRLIDIVVSAVLLVLLSPVFLLIAIAIKITTPRLAVFYPWHVIGLSGRPFTGYKFTTMVADADEQKASLIHRNEMQGPVFKIKDDPRVTRVGRFLRKFSLNELPQLWSVLKGDMSLVGPRPAGPDELVRYQQWHKRKLSIRPGITCLWQVSGRNRIANFDDWVRLDLEYIERWSLWLDFRILAQTAWAVVSGSGS